MQADVAADRMINDIDSYPLKHVFQPGRVIRSLFIPAGNIVMGKIHAHAHWVALLEGTASVLTESGGMELVIGPWEGLSPVGTKRFLLAHTDTVWATEHLCDATDHVTLEAFAVAPSYTAIGMAEPVPVFPTLLVQPQAAEENLV